MARPNTLGVKRAVHRARRRRLHRAGWRRVDRAGWGWVDRARWGRVDGAGWWRGVHGSGWWWVDGAGWWRGVHGSGWWWVDRARRWWRGVERGGGREQRSGRHRRGPGRTRRPAGAPSFTAPATVRTWLESGGVDPRVVSMLDSVLAHHTIGVSNLEVLSSPVHVQSFDIVSVDGQPVGQNFAARDLVTEIAAMDPTTRPDEIGTPWPIQSPGFSTGPASTNGLHLAFEAPGTNATPTQDAAYSGIDTGQPQPQ